MLQNYPDFSVNTPIDHVAVEERVARLNTRSIKKDSKIQALKLRLKVWYLLCPSLAQHECVLSAPMVKGALEYHSKCW